MGIGVIVILCLIISIFNGVISLKTAGIKPIIYVWTTNKFLRQAAQRLALLALGRAWILFGRRKKLQARKMPQNPQRQVHDVLGGYLESFNSL